MACLCADPVRVVAGHQLHCARLRRGDALTDAHALAGRAVRLERVPELRRRDWGDRRPAMAAGETRRRFAEIGNGAVAAFMGTDLQSVPTPARRLHRLLRSSEAR